MNLENKSIYNIHPCDVADANLICDLLLKTSPQYTEGLHLTELTDWNTDDLNAAVELSNELKKTKCSQCMISSGDERCALAEIKI